MKFPPNFNNPFKRENLPERLQNFREARENRKAVKRNFKENIPLNFRERSNARTKSSGFCCCPGHSGHFV